VIAAGRSMAMRDEVEALTVDQGLSEKKGRNAPTNGGCA